LVRKSHVDRILRLHRGLAPRGDPVGWRRAVAAEVALTTRFD